LASPTGFEPVFWP